MNTLIRRARVRVARTVLVAAGAGLAGFGLVTLVTTIPPAKLLWLPVWMAAAVVFHDALLVPVLSLTRAWLRRSGRTWPTAVTATIEIGFMTFATLALFVVPELWAQHRGSGNPTILRGDYAGRLVLVAVVFAAVMLVVSRVLLDRARRREDS